MISSLVLVIVSWEFVIVAPLNEVFYLSPLCGLISTGDSANNSGIIRDGWHWTSTHSYRCKCVELGAENAALRSTLMMVNEEEMFY